MNPTSFVSLGSRTLNLQHIAYWDLNYPREQSQGGGSICRLWFSQPLSMPGLTQYLDLGGAEAQAFRRHVQRLADTGFIVPLTEETPTPATQNAKTKGAGRG